MKKILEKEWGKRGISPIVATIILIGFVVLIIVLIWAWSRGVYVEEIEKEGALAQVQIQCNEVKIETERVGGTIHIRNIGSVTINGLVLNEDLGGLARLSNVYIDVGVGESFPLSQSIIDCDATNEPDTPGALCQNANSVTVIPSLQPEGRGAPLVSCTNARLVLTL